MKYQFNFQEAQQDLIFVVVEASELSNTMTGTIVGLPLSCSSRVVEMYTGKAVDFADNHIGANFEYADPANQFQVMQTKWIIESIELIEEAEDEDYEED